MILSFWKIEAVIAEPFENENHVNTTNTFVFWIDAISKSNIHPLFCETHRNISSRF